MYAKRRTKQGDLHRPWTNKMPHVHRTTISLDEEHISVGVHVIRPQRVLQSAYMETRFNRPTCSIRIYIPLLCSLLPALALRVSRLAFYSISTMEAKHVYLNFREL